MRSPGAGALAALLLAACATLSHAPRTLTGVECKAMPAPATAPGKPLAISVLPAQAATLRIGAMFNQQGDIELLLDTEAFRARLEDDVRQLLHGVAAGEDPGAGRLEIPIATVVSRSESGGWLDLTGPVWSEIEAHARVVRSGPVTLDAPWPWTLRGRGEKRVVYMQATDHAETLAAAYCTLLQDLVARAPEMYAAAGEP